ncbi:MAG: hypothetical protein PVF72_01995, partial [Desulfobacterales bacterium]
SDLTVSIDMFELQKRCSATLNCNSVDAAPFGSAIAAARNITLMLRSAPESDKKLIYVVFRIYTTLPWALKIEHF